MITTGRAAYQIEERVAEYVGLSSDSKTDNDVIIQPHNGDIFREIDTGNIFRYNEETGSWVQQPAQGGGGGSQTTGVTSFNGRTGAVTPAQGDYTAALVGAVDKAGDTMTGNLDMSGNQIRGVLSIVANGSTGNAGVQFASNGNFTNIVCGVSTSASFSANAVDFYNHNLDRVNSINMTSESTIEDANYIGGNVEENNRTALDFSVVNEATLWAQGNKRLTVNGIGIDANASVLSNLGAPVQDNDAARKIDVDTVGNTVNEIIDGTEPLPYLPDNGGTLSGPLNMGNNKITMGGTPTETTDVTNKGYVDGVVKVVSDEVDGILAGTTPVALPIATETHLGGIKVGAGLSIDDEGVLSSNESAVLNSLPEQMMVDIVNVQRTETTNTAEIQIADKQPDGTYTTADHHGVITLIPAGMGPDGVNGAGLMTASDKAKLDGLPVPTAEDEGKLLVVQNGQYVLVTISSILGGA